MQYQDSIYGTTEINEPVLLALLQSNALLRLKGVYQHGITAILKITPDFTRYDHSIGTMLLARRLGATIEEQIAALIHDVSHTAFSHVIDFVFNDQGEQSYHERIKEQHVAESDIPAILEQHGYHWQDFIDEEKFPILEQPAPALCADRLDYFLRDLEFLELAGKQEIQTALNALTVKEQKIVVTDPEVARWLAYTYIEVDRRSWSSFREVGLYQLTANVLNTALDMGVIDDSDWWRADEQLWEKLNAAEHSEIRQQVRLINSNTQFVRDEQAPTFSVETKIRSIDPDVVDMRQEEQAALPLSLLDDEFSRYRDDYHQLKKGCWPMRVV